VGDEDLAAPGAVEVADLVADAGGDLPIRLVGGEGPPVAGVDIEHGLEPHHVGRHQRPELVAKLDLLSLVTTSDGKQHNETKHTHQVLLG